MPASFPLGFGPGPQPPASAFPLCKMRCAIRHSFCTAPLHAQRAMVYVRKNFGNPKQETIGQLPAGKYGQGNISPSRMRSGRKQAFRQLCRKNRPDSQIFQRLLNPPLQKCQSALPGAFYSSRFSFCSSRAARSAAACFFSARSRIFSCRALSSPIKASEGEMAMRRIKPFRSRYTTP